MVEDNRLQQILLEHQICKNMGFSNDEVVFAKNGQEAFEAIKIRLESHMSDPQNHPNFGLVLTDQCLPYMTGDKLLKATKKLYKT